MLLITQVNVAPTSLLFVVMLFPVSGNSTPFLKQVLVTRPGIVELQKVVRDPSTRQPHVPLSTMPAEVPLLSLIHSWTVCRIYIIYISIYLYLYLYIYIMYINYQVYKLQHFTV